MILKDLQSEAERELKMRRAKYPAWIQSGLLNQVQAEKQIQRLEQISKLLQAMTNREFETISARVNTPATPSNQGDLFA